MKNIQILIIFLFITPFLFSQKYAGKWALGCGACLPPNDGGSTVDFTQDSAIATAAYRKMSLITNAGICDKNGDFLFYTNSYWIANKDNDTMMAGTGLYHTSSALGYATHGGAAPQGAIVLPIPNDTNQYYLIHETYSGYNGQYCPHKLIANKIDMQQDNGRGAVVIKNMILSENRPFSWGQMTACKHADGKQWWLLLPKLEGDYYYRFLITSNGIQGPDSQAVAWGGIPFVNIENGQGVFSPDGTKYACYVWGNYNRLMLFDFDRCKGLLSNKKEIIISDNGASIGFGGCAFSPNSRFIYVSDVTHIHQYDTEAIDLALSDTILMTYDGFQSPGQTNFGYGLLADNKSIYFGTAGSTAYLHQIKYPDSLGMKCQPIQRAVYVYKAYEYGLPNYPNYNLGALAQPCDSVLSVASSISKNEIEIYPNPAQDIVHIEIPQNAQNAIFSLFDLSGKEVLIEPLQGSLSKVQVGKLPKGVYIYTVSFNGGREYGKVLIE